MSQDGVKRGSVKRWWISAVVVFALGMALALVAREQGLDMYEITAIIESK